MIIKDIIKFLIFLTYTIMIFFVSNYIILGILILFNIIVMLIYKLSLYNAVRNIKNIFIFIILTCVINFLLEGLNSAILISIRLIIVCNATYIFSQIITTFRLKKVIETLLSPLKIFKININNIGIIISIAISFIPILTDEITQIKYSLKAKGFNTNAFNIIIHVKYIIIPIFISIINKINAVEFSLKAKGYVD